MFTWLFVYASMQVRADMYIVDFLDWLHIGWRLRTIYLNPSKCLALGGLAITHTVLAQDLVHYGLCAADVDASNKQSYTGRMECLTGMVLLQVCSISWPLVPFHVHNVNLCRYLVHVLYRCTAPAAGMLKLFDICKVHKQRADGKKVTVLSENKEGIRQKLLDRHGEYQ